MAHVNWLAKPEAYWCSHRLLPPVLASVASMVKDHCGAGGGTTGYYSTTTASIGWQIGAQSKAIIFLFMTQDSLDRFRNSEGWSVGGDASVAVLKVGANGNIDSSTATGPIQAFVLTNSGLMAGVTLEGTKVTKLKSL